MQCCATKTIGKSPEKNAGKHDDESMKHRNLRPGFRTKSSLISEGRAAISLRSNQLTSSLIGGEAVQGFWGLWGGDIFGYN